MNLKGTKSEENIKAALAGESMARNKYTYYAMQAKAEGETELASFFERMAGNEMIHAKIWFSTLNDGLGNTLDNLQDAANGEHSEWTGMYPEFAKTAREEGLDELADMFEKVAAIEKDHEHQFMKKFVELKKRQQEKEGNAPAAPVEQEKPRMTKEVPAYRCVFCGAVFEEHAVVCPVCKAIGAFQDCIIEKEI